MCYYIREVRIWENKMRLKVRRARIDRIRIYHINHPEVIQEDLAKKYKLTQTRISQILRENKVENNMEEC
jgi:Mor family transcriptional regulator